MLAWAIVVLFLIYNLIAEIFDDIAFFKATLG